MATLPVFPLGFIGNKHNLIITSDYKMRQLSGENKPRFHHGVDIGLSVGTQITSPVNGDVVIRSIQSKGAGLYLAIRFDVDSVSYYLLLMHLHEAKVSFGQRVSVGDVIATTGGSKSDGNKAGSSTGPHLHLEIRKGRNSSSCSVDPKYYWLAKHSLYIGSNIVFGARANLETFSSTELKTQTASTSQQLDTDIIWSETEYVVPKKKITNISSERLANGIWQITKLVLDSSVESKQVTDSGISTQTGSLLNFFRNVCQEPLVEFSGDTFGNQYYWMVRRPPYDKDGINKMMELTMINIDESDIINTNLEFNIENIYSWYQYIPYYDLMGIKEISNIVPAVFFPQYAQIWGSKPLVIQSNYYSYIQSGRFNDNKRDNKNNDSNIIRNAIMDFKYIIETNAYTPFTRRGTITIQGDRRIKRGTLVMLPTSGEIYYVDSVSNEYSISTNNCSRTTTLQVSRGMYPNYINGDYIGDDLMGYFNIIDFGKDFDINKIKIDNWRDYVSKWKVNESVFNFFMAKQQVYFEQIADGYNKYGMLKSVNISSKK